jgi:hypothetical protein
MATLYISEYRDMPVTIGQFLPVPQEPTTTTQSAAFNTNTRFIRVHADAICSIKFGTSPTAVTTDARMAANTTEYFGVIAGQKLAVVTNT